MEKIYIITGTSSGIGKALANLILNNAPCKVLGISRRQTIEHPSYFHINADLSQSIIDTTLKEITKILTIHKAKELVLINNAGTVTPIGKIGCLDNKQIERAFYLNSITPAILTNFIVESAIEQNVHLKILNIGTGASTNPIEGWSTYCASKAALKMLTEVWKKEGYQNNWNIDFQEFSPGVVDTEMQTEIRSVTNDQFDRLDQFKKFKTDNLLESPEKTAEKIFELFF